jgi:hypothetical protein
MIVLSYFQPGIVDVFPEADEQGAAKEVCSRCSFRKRDIHARHLQGIALELANAHLEFPSALGPGRAIMASPIMT